MPDVSPDNPQVPTLSPRRRQLLDAALHTLAEWGLKGLTHRAVDRRAGLPEGSCSAYWRTRQALQAALTEYVARALLDDVDELAARIQASGADHDVSIGGAVELFQRWLDQREMLVARLELTMAASRDPELRHLLAGHRSRLIAVVEQIMTAAGTDQGPARAEAVVASFDGILLSALLKPAAERPAFLLQSLDLLGESLAARQAP